MKLTMYLAEQKSKGYFLSKDFAINQEFISTFNQWKKLEVNKISITNLELVEYTFKDLSDAKPLEKY